MTSQIDVHLFVFYLSHGLVQVCEIKQRKSRYGVREKNDPAHESLVLDPLYLDGFSRTNKSNRNGKSPFCVLRNHRSILANFDIFLSLSIVFTLTNIVHPDEMLHE